MTASKIFLFLCLSFVLGIAVSSFAHLSRILTVGAAALAIILILSPFLFKKAGFFIFSLCVLFFIAGVWHYQQKENEILNNVLAYYNTREEIVKVIGTVVTEPDIRDNNIKLTAAVDQLMIDNSWLPAAGRVLVTADRYPEYKYGDKITITGRLDIPPQFEDFNYRDYLLKDGIISVMYFPEIELIDINQGNQIYADILVFKNRLRRSINQNLSPPQSSILGAMILGDKKTISEDWKKKLNITGMRHITAVSGLHVAILSSIVMLLLIYAGFWRGQAFYLTIAVIIFFIIMTGIQPSGVRAGIMGGLFIFGQKLGRLSVSSRAIVFAAAAMLFLNPLLLKLDVGFQLSFLATMGMIYFAPFIQYKLAFLPTLGFFPLKELLSITFAAQIFTLPILIYNFGYISLIAPLSNILIVPLLPFVLGAGFVFGLVGIISPALGWIFSFPSWAVLNYITGVVDWLSRVSWIYMPAEGLHWAWFAFFYLILGLAAWKIKERQRLAFLNY